MDVARSESIFCWPRTRLVLDFRDERLVGWRVAEGVRAVLAEDVLALLCIDCVDVVVVFFVAELALPGFAALWVDVPVADSFDEVC